MSADEGGGTAPMSATNGELHTSTPDPPTMATPGKRKRVSSHDEKAAQDASSSTSKGSQDKVKLQETLRNLVEILSKTDGELHLLSCPLSTSLSKPRSKRAKVSGDKDEGVSIQTRVASDRYNTLSEFLSDIERASAAVIERNKAQASATPADGTPLTETVNRIAAFKKHLNSLVRQAQTTPANVKTETSEDDAEAPTKSTPSNVETRSDSLVLTLFGNPANPKQLYSSLQKSVKVSLPSDDPQTEKFVEVQAPLHEEGLPNGISITKVEPHNLEAKPKEPTRTFGEVFAPRQTLPQLEPPRRARSSSRGAFSSWVDPFEAVTNFKSFLGDRNNYCLAPLPSGQWLQYGGVTSSPSYWNRRQKQQSQQHVDERFHEDSAMWADDDASIWQGVYSSFAPSFDSSGAVVQADSKDLVWWKKRGSKRLHMLLSVPDQQEYEETVSERPGNIGELDESTLEEMVKSFNPENFADNVTHADAPKNKDADENDGNKKEENDDEGPQNSEDVLRDISELLETLSSYQRIRNLEAPGSQGADTKEIVPDMGTPDAPSAAEQTVYETLRSSLAALVSTLPPHAVAKLNGDQLDELNISRKVVIENPDYHGTMEKDEFTIQQERSAAMAPMAGSVNRTSTPSRSSNYPAGYNQRAYATNARTQQPQSGFQTPQPYYGGRQPSASAPYTPGPQQQHYAGARGPATPSQRPSYLPGYSQPTPQYNQGNAAPQFQRPAQNGYAPYPPQQGMPPAQASPQQPYTPRPGQPAPYNVPYGAGRSASPQKQQAYAAPRTPYMTPGPNPQNSQRYASQQQQQQQQQQQPPPYGNYPPNQVPQTSGSYSNSAAAMTYARSAAEQAALMDRNKVQLASHQTRQSPSTPQPSIEQGNSQDRSVTPGSKQNGTPAAS